MNYEKIIIALVEHFGDTEGTDHLGMRREGVNLDGLSAEENAELTRLRDIARTNTGWHEYR